MWNECIELKIAPISHPAKCIWWWLNKASATQSYFLKLSVKEAGMWPKEMISHNQTFMCGNPPPLAHSLLFQVHQGAHPVRESQKSPVNKQEFQ